MHVVAHQSLRELKGLENRAGTPTMMLKLRALVLARQGWFAGRIAEALGKSPRTIQQWVIRYNRQGLEGLRDCRGGNHRHLTPEQEQQLKDHLDAAAEDPHAGVRHAAELLPFIEQHFGATYSLSGLYELLHRLDYEWLMPRPRHEKNDPAAVEAFKKKRPRSWSKLPPNTPASRSKSGSRTKRASVSKAH